MQQGLATYFLTLRNGANVFSGLQNGTSLGGTVAVVESEDVNYPVEAGETTLGHVTISTTGDPTSPIVAVFDTNGEAGSLRAAAESYGAHHFNWFQVVHSDALPANQVSDDVNVVGALLGAPRISPPSGGTGQTDIEFRDGVYADDKPLLWNEIQVGPDDFAADQSTTKKDFYSLREFTDNSEAPAPAGVNPAVGDPSLQTSLNYNVGPWVGDISSVGESVEIRVWLVAVDINGDPVRYLRGFSYQQAENAAFGGGSAISGVSELPGSPATTGDNEDALLGSF